MSKLSSATPKNLMDVLRLQFEYPGRYNALSALGHGDRGAVPVTGDISDPEDAIPTHLTSSRVTLFSHYEDIYNKTQSTSAPWVSLSSRFHPNRVNGTIMETMRGLSLVASASRSYIKATRTHGETLWNNTAHSSMQDKTTTGMMDSLRMLDPLIDDKEVN